MNTFILFTVICSSTIHTESIVAFPLKQWLRDRATVLPSTYLSYLVISNRYLISLYIFGPACSFKPFERMLTRRGLNERVRVTQFLVLFGCF
jgi:hypothetical protein